MDKSVKRDVTKRYKKMLRSIEGEEYFKGKENCYTCQECGRVTKTIDVDSGVTPMGIECPFCHGEAMSSFYSDIAPNVKATYEWYRPTLEETLSLVDEHFFTVNHILSGGLLRREKR